MEQEQDPAKLIWSCFRSRYAKVRLEIVSVSSKVISFLGGKLLDLPFDFPPPTVSTSVLKQCCACVNSEL